MLFYEGFYREFIPFRFYNLNYIGHTRNLIWWKKKLPNNIKESEVIMLGEGIGLGHKSKSIVCVFFQKKKKKGLYAC